VDWRNENGTTLVELMVSVAIGALVTLGIAMVFVYAVNQFNLLVDENDAEEQLLSASYFSRLYFSQAVTTQVGTVTDPIFTDTSGNAVSTYADPLKGTIACGMAFDANTDFNGTIATAAGAKPEDANQALVAVFRRENGDFSSGVGKSYFVVTAVYFRPPQGYPGNPGNQSGALTFVSGLTAANLNLANSTAGGVRLDHISSFRIDCSAAPETSNAQVVTINIGTRYFKDIDRSRWNYLPRSGGQAGPPAGIPSYRDVTFSTSIGLRDNNLGQSLTGLTGQAELLHGGVYYLKFSAPPISNF